MVRPLRVECMKRVYHNHGKARRGRARLGMARPGEAGLGEARHGTL